MINWNNWQGRYANIPLSFRVCNLLRDFRSDLQNPRAQNHPQAWGNDGAVAIAEILQFATNNMEQFNYIGLARSIHILAGVARIAHGLDWVPDDAVAQFENAWIVAATNQLGNFNPQNLANSIWALAHLNVDNMGFNGNMLQQLRTINYFNNYQGAMDSIWQIENARH